MSAPNPNQPRAGVASTPTRAAGTKANDAFNAMLRAAEKRNRQTTPTLDPALSLAPRRTK